MKMIVAAGRNGAIGRRGELIWHISDDLRRFKSLTMGHPVVMGRKTWESLPKRPLPGRLNIVVTRNKDYSAEGATVVNSIDDALKALSAAGGRDDAFVMGGEQIYSAMIPFADTIHLTEIDADCPDADAFISIPADEWETTETSEWHTDPTRDNLRYRFKELRIKNLKFKIY